MENKITIKFSEELNDIHLESNTPDLDGLIRFVVENKERINVERITVICDDTNFDKKGFSEILKKSIKDFLEKIVLNEKQFKEQIEIIKKNNGETI